MLLLFIIAILGWIIGVHAPWWIVVSCWAGGFYMLGKDNSGLEGLYLIIGLAAFLVPMILSSLLLGDMLSGVGFKYLLLGE